MQDFKIGDKVCLIINKEDVMTVCSVYGRRLIECSWIGKEGKIHQHSFRPESLILATDPNSINNRSRDEMVKILKSDLPELD